MIRAFTAEQIREAERPLLEAGEPLMQRAAHGLALRTLLHLRELGARRVLLLVGSGSNGGDALIAGALLRGRGVRVDVLPCAKTLHEEGERALRCAGGRFHPVLDPAVLDEHPPVLVLDAILGIGGRPELAGDLRAVLDAVRGSGARVLAVDVPSGLHATTGQCAEGILAAAETITFGAPKSGLLLPDAAEAVGHVHLVDIGLASRLPQTPAIQRLQTEDAARLWPEPGREDSKYTRGVVEITAGSEQYPGAAVLSASAAARAGAGMVRLNAPRAVLDHVLAVRPEVVGGQGKHQAAVVGSGVPEDDERIADVLAALQHETRPHSERPLAGVIDAGGLDRITRDMRFHPDVVLTPHRGEAERLAQRLGIDPDQPAGRLARALAEATGATVLLKGSVTVVAPPAVEEPLLTQDDATAQLATAGSGDVLGGLLGTLLAAGLAGPEAAALAALVHGRAGVRASRGGRAPLVALDVAAEIPAVIAAILPTREDPRFRTPRGDA